MHKKVEVWNMETDIQITGAEALGRLRAAWRSGGASVYKCVDWLWRKSLGSLKKAAKESRDEKYEDVAVPAHVQWWLRKLGEIGTRDWRAFRVLTQFLGCTYMRDRTTVPLQRAAKAQFDAMMVRMDAMYEDGCRELQAVYACTGAEIMRWFVPQQAETYEEMDHDTLPCTIHECSRGAVLLPGLRGMAWGSNAKLASYRVVRWLREGGSKYIRAYWDFDEDVESHRVWGPMPWRSGEFRGIEPETDGVYMSILMSIGNWLMLTKEYGSWMEGWWRGICMELAPSAEVLVRRNTGGLRVSAKEANAVWATCLRNLCSLHGGDRKWLKAYHAAGNAWAKALGLPHELWEHDRYGIFDTW